MSLYPRRIGPQYLVAGDGPSPSVMRQRFASHYSIAPAAASATAILNAYELPATASVLTTGFSQPDVPRLLRYVGVAGLTQNVTVTGRDAGGNIITETVALNGATPVNGAKAFDTISQIDIAAGTATGGENVSIGTQDVFGLPWIVERAAFVLLKLFNGATDAGTVATHAELARNTYDPAGTPNGVAALEIVYLA